MLLFQQQNLIIKNRINCIHNNPSPILQLHSRQKQPKSDRYNFSSFSLMLKKQKQSRRQQQPTKQIQTYAYTQSNAIAQIEMELQSQSQKCRQKQKQNDKQQQEWIQNTNQQSFNKQNNFIRSSSHQLQLSSDISYGIHDNKFLCARNQNINQNYNNFKSNNKINNNNSVNNANAHANVNINTNVNFNGNGKNNPTHHHSQSSGLTILKQCQPINSNKRVKTSQNIATTTTLNAANSQILTPEQQFIKTFYNTNEQFIKTHKPFLQNKRIIFNIKNNRNNRTNFIHNCHHNNYNYNKNTHNSHNQLAHTLKQTNIQKLKKQIIELDKQDFVSYRSKGYTSTDEIKIVQNQKISKYNYQNSMIVEWKGKAYHKPVIARPSSTIGITSTTNISSPLNSNNNYYCNGGFVGISGHTSVAKKYFSKPKTRNNSASQTTPTQICGSNLSITQQQQQGSKNNRLKIKTEQIAIGLNMFRGRMHRKKVNSSFQINY